MFVEKFQNIRLGLTFDDVLLIPSKTRVDPVETEIRTKLTRNLEINIPIVSSPMDTVTGPEMAIGMAHLGGIGIIHRNQSIEDQRLAVRSVKREESLIIREVITIAPENTVAEAIKLMEEKRIAGLPVVDKGILVGIITGRDVRFLKEKEKKVNEIMTKNPVTGKENITIEEAMNIMQQHRIEKLPIVDNSGKLMGLITAKDIIKRQKYPNSTRDSEGRLRVGAAVGPFDIRRAEILEKEGVDVIVVDTAHAHNVKVLESIKEMRKRIDVDIIAGNIATAEAAKDLISIGVDALRVGIGPGSICTTRIIAGVGVPQLEAISQVAEVADPQGIPIIADGGIRYSGDIVKAIAAGANSVMLGNLLAGTDEAPGQEIMIGGRKYKSYRGMGSLGVIQKGISDRYGKIGESKYVPEGVEGAVPYKGKLEGVVFQLIGGLKSGMGYVGASNIDELRKNTKFIRMTGEGLRESHPHDVTIITEVPNYPTR
ncbi:MAG: IMP dehydrogenase [Thermoplasmata archaeon]|jgi:IMP dehydrogenase|nr:IMP dehydrogenase [Euryarchaeota archaeon]MVT14077.1 IMP dehydrogenase [Euryarchaeota archaeon]MVT35762.1 IMP dehydrogenase [Euryarchaeota archaeon]